MGLIQYPLTLLQNVLYTGNFRCNYDGLYNGNTCEWKDCLHFGTELSSHNIDISWYLITINLVMYYGPGISLLNITRYCMQSGFEPTNFTIHPNTWNRPHGRDMGRLLEVLILARYREHAGLSWLPLTCLSLSWFASCHRNLFLPSVLVNEIMWLITCHQSWPWLYCHTDHHSSDHVHAQTQGSKCLQVQTPQMTRLFYSILAQP